MTSLQLLRLAHFGMALALALSLLAGYLAYGLESALPLGATIACHIALILFPALVKIGYAARLVALKQLGRAVN